MLIEMRHHFGTSRQTAFELLFSEAYEQASASQTHLARTVLDDRISDGRRHRRVHVVPEQTFPPALARVIGHDRFSYVIDEDHDLADTSMRWVLHPDALADKVKIHGSWLLTDAPDGCERLVKINVRVHIPIVGRKIERQIGTDLRTGYEAAAAFAQRWLTEHAPAPAPVPAPADPNLQPTDGPPETA